MMRCSILVVLALVLGGCRPDAPPVALTPLERTVQPDPAFVPPDLPADPVPDATVIVANEPDMPIQGVPPPGVGAPESGCEQSCGDVHDCALLEPTYTPAAAAAIELGCVDACLHTPERETLFGCGRPAAIEVDACSSFLACVEAEWPTGSDGESPSEVVVERTSGCVRGCEMFARCWNPSTPSEFITQCIEGCQRTLDDEAERRFGTCSELPDCADIIACVDATPGA
jgi:hypothetical protein